MYLMLIFEALLNKLLLKNDLWNGGAGSCFINDKNREYSLVSYLSFSLAQRKELKV